MNKNKDKIQAHTFNVRQTKCMVKSIRNDHEGHYIREKERTYVHLTKWIQNI